MLVGRVKEEHRAHKLMVALFIGLEVLILYYVGISFFVATQLTYAPAKTITERNALIIL